jgi:hypothetical protein
MLSKRTCCSRPTLDNEDEYGILLTFINCVTVSYVCHSVYLHVNV